MLDFVGSDWVDLSSQEKLWLLQDGWAEVRKAWDAGALTPSALSGSAELYKSHLDVLKDDSAVGGEAHDLLADIDVQVEEVKELEDVGLLIRGDGRWLRPGEAVEINESLSIVYDGEFYTAAQFARLAAEGRFDIEVMIDVTEGEIHVEYGRLEYELRGDIAIEKFTVDNDGGDGENDLVVLIEGRLIPDTYVDNPIVDKMTIMWNGEEVNPYDLAQGLVERSIYVDIDPQRDQVTIIYDGGEYTLRGQGVVRKFAVDNIDFDGGPELYIVTHEKNFLSAGSDDRRDAVEAGDGDRISLVYDSREVTFDFLIEEGVDISVDPRAEVVTVSYAGATYTLRGKGAVERFYKDAEDVRGSVADELAFYVDDAKLREGDSQQPRDALQVYFKGEEITLEQLADIQGVTVDIDVDKAEVKVRYEDWSYTLTGDFVIQLFGGELDPAKGAIDALIAEVEGLYAEWQDTEKNWDRGDLTPQALLDAATANEDRLEAIEATIAADYGSQDAWTAPLEEWIDDLRKDMKREVEEAEAAQRANGGGDDSDNGPTVDELISAVRDLTDDWSKIEDQWDAGDLTATQLLDRAGSIEKSLSEIEDGAPADSALEGMISYLRFDMAGEVDEANSRADLSTPGGSSDSTNFNWETPKELKDVLKANKEEIQVHVAEGGGESGVAAYVGLYLRAQAALAQWAEDDQGYKTKDIKKAQKEFDKAFEGFDIVVDLSISQNQQEPSRTALGLSEEGERRMMPGEAEDNPYVLYSIQTADLPEGGTVYQLTPERVTEFFVSRFSDVAFPNVVYVWAPNRIAPIPDGLTEIPRGQLPENTSVLIHMPSSQLERLPDSATYLATATPLADGGAPEGDGIEDDWSAEDQELADFMDAVLEEESADELVTFEFYSKTKRAICQNLENPYPDIYSFNAAAIESYITPLMSASEGIELSPLVTGSGMINVFITGGQVNTGALQGVSRSRLRIDSDWKILVVAPREDVYTNSREYGAVITGGSLEYLGESTVSSNESAFYGNISPTPNGLLGGSPDPDLGGVPEGDEVLEDGIPVEFYQRSYIALHEGLIAYDQLSADSVSTFPVVYEFDSHAFRFYLEPLIEETGIDLSPVITAEGSVYVYVPNGRIHIGSLFGVEETTLDAKQAQQILLLVPDDASYTTPLLDFVITRDTTRLGDTILYEGASSLHRAIEPKSEEPMPSLTDGYDVHFYEISFNELHENLGNTTPELYEFDAEAVNTYLRPLMGEPGTIDLSSVTASDGSVYVFVPDGLIDTIALEGVKPTFLTINSFVQGQKVLILARQDPLYGDVGSEYTAVINSESPLLGRSALDPEVEPLLYGAMEPVNPDPNPGVFPPGVSGEEIPWLGPYPGSPMVEEPGFFQGLGVAGVVLAWVDIFEYLRWEQGLIDSSQAYYDYITDPLNLSYYDPEETVFLGEARFNGTVYETVFLGAQFSDEYFGGAGDMPARIDVSETHGLQVDTGEFNDIVTARGSFDLRVNTGDGNDYVGLESVEWAEVNAGAGDDLIHIYDSSGHIDINAGSGDNYIVISDFLDHDFLAHIDVKTGGGRDTLLLSNTSGTVDVDTSRDDDVISIVNASDEVFIDAGRGDDDISVIDAAAEVYIDAGDGDDRISIVNASGHIDLGTGTDEVTIVDSHDVYVEQTDGNNSVFIADSEGVQINFSEGANSARLTGDVSDIELISGDGEDTFDFRDGYTGDVRISNYDSSRDSIVVEHGTLEDWNEAAENAWTEVLNAADHYLSSGIDLRSLTISLQDQSLNISWLTSVFLDDNTTPDWYSHYVHFTDDFV